MRLASRTADFERAAVSADKASSFGSADSNGKAAGRFICSREEFAQSRHPPHAPLRDAAAQRDHKQRRPQGVGEIQQPPSQPSVQLSPRRGPVSRRYTTSASTLASRTPKPSSSNRCSPPWVGAPTSSARSATSTASGLRTTPSTTPCWISATPSFDRGQITRYALRSAQVRHSGAGLCLGCRCGLVVAHKRRQLPALQRQCPCACRRQAFPRRASLSGRPDDGLS